ncbi:MAG: F0F1 ATP synthase subunit epsilon [Acidobacteria bacterium]|nr:F0F1 ATP synthase subunit epsilon [Acidobacteriota bacterium]
MAEKINLEVITPEKLVLREVVDEVIVPGMEGEMGILPNHTPLISQLKTGVLSYKSGNDKVQLHVSGGFVEVLSDRVSVLSDVAERTDEIDLERARACPRTRRKRLTSSGGEDVELQTDPNWKLQRALIRIQLANSN